MAIFAMFIGRGMSAETYDALRKDIGWDTKHPKGAVFHAAGLDANGDMRVTDIWETQGDLDHFFTTALAPAFARLGAPLPEAEILVAHNIDAYAGVDRYRV